MNFIKGCTAKWSLPHIVDCCQNGMPVSIQDLKENEIHSFCLAFKYSIQIIQDIKFQSYETMYDGNDEYTPGLQKKVVN